MITGQPGYRSNRSARLVNQIDWTPYLDGCSAASGARDGLATAGSKKASATETESRATASAATAAATTAGDRILRTMRDDGGCLCWVGDDEVKLT